MESVNNRKAILVKDIEDMKKGQFEEMLLISYYGLASYFKSLFSFGSKSDITKDNLNVIKEMFNILKTERNLLNFILQNIDKFNVDATQDVVSLMDELNDKTVEYYYNVINEIEDAVDMNEERRGIRPKKNFQTLTQTDYYATQVIALAEDRDKIKEFLKFEDDFWKYIKEYEYSVEVPYDIAVEMCYATPLFDENKNVSGLRILVPKVINLQTALLAIKCYIRAHNIYKSLGSTLIPESKCDYIGSQDLYQRKLNAKSKSLLK